MKQTINTCIFFLSTIIMISCGGRSKPIGVYYGGTDLAPSVYYYVFEENGSMRVSQGKLETENCRTEGYWSTDEKEILQLQV